MTIEEYLEEAKKQTPSTVGEFIQKLSKEKFTYNSEVNYTMVAMVAAQSAISNRSDSAGMTGFQASCLYLSLADQLLVKDPGSPVGITLYEQMLYPYYKDNFTSRTISSDTFEWLQNKARILLQEFTPDDVLPSVIKHWNSIANGKAPFGYKVKQ